MTRGLYGIRKNGVDKLLYSNHDSYPDGLGEAVVKFCRRHSIEELNFIFDQSNESTDNDFIKDSLFCEHAYIINLDENVLEYWRGFQTTVDKGNRYGEGFQLTYDGSSRYYPCKQKLSLPLKKLPKDAVLQMIETSLDKA